ncbi:RNA polymerase sigma factor [Agromyces cerinus]|uniref:RNA polymerase, sigma subunit, ECF family n=1 Tax=Agromyces cerinus subsp. cerinus TaxID=232089 RepID=A0A1N6GLJ2_9MICO|nr:sigma-70 family RNA polymerase sigma factor [Agromyces cerinus]SIO08292.1 RNA polymerase, sigma subunit, ECF family [Agromyces cerinus subsp. cerinus]
MKARRRDERDRRLTRLHESLAPELLRYFVRRTTEPADAADLLAEAFLVAWRRIRDLPVDDHEAKLWMYGVAGRVHGNWIRGRRRAERLAAPLRAQLMLSAVPPADDEALDVRAAVAVLPNDQRELIMLVYWDGMPVPDAATALGIPITTARGRMHRAKRALRGVLSDEPNSTAEHDRLGSFDAAGA